MIFRFISRDRYQELAALKDRRIAELEQERKMLWDKICLCCGKVMTIDATHGVIPAAGRETHGARDGETPVRRLIVLILQTADDVTKPGIRPVVHASKTQAL